MRNLVVLTLLGWAGSASAADGTISLGLQGGVFLPDDLEVLGNSFALAPRVGYWFNPTLGVELDLNLLLAGKTQFGTPDPYRYTGVLPVVSMVGRVFADQPVSLILNVGAAPFFKSVHDQGALDLPTGEKVDVDFAGVAGPGFLVPVGDFAFRADIRFILNVGTENYQNTGDSFIDWLPSLGFVYLPVGPRDSDKDGITDDEDRCLDQAEDLDAFEDQDGCPDTDNDADTVVDASDACPNEAEDVDQFEDDNGCPDPDNDQDGVLDADDQCPAEVGTIATAGCPDADGDTVTDTTDECVNEAGKPEAYGCPDRDGDLVPDYRDECPDEKAHEGIDPSRDSGCNRNYFMGLGAIVILENIEFATGKATLVKKTNGLLDGIAELMKRHESIKLVQVEGHTDSQGDDAANLKLSQARAETVKAYLVDKGVEEGRLKAVGFGETKPIEDNGTPAGREKNRRVAFTILEQDPEKHALPGKTP